MAIRVRPEGLRILASFAAALGGRVELIIDFGDERFTFAKPGARAT